MKISELYEQWLAEAVHDDDIIRELKEMAQDAVWMEDAFYQELSFGTGGLRGVLGAGTNRMNLYTVAKASLGLSNYINRNYTKGKNKIAIAYDSRIKSKEFAQVAAGIFAAQGLEVHIFSELMPTPCLSFAVRELACVAGIVLTASHNPAQYNGYKVYGEDGCQITSQAARMIQEEINRITVFEDFKQIYFDPHIQSEKVHEISEHVITAFLREIEALALSQDEHLPKDIPIVYSPLNGSGRKPILQILKQNGYSNITVVKEQELPDGHFRTCPYPNPEMKEAMELAIQYAERTAAELAVATDPDCDRIGVAVREPGGNYRLLSGNETGVLLADYICSRRMAAGHMPQEPLMIKTIVTTEMAERIARHYGVKMIDVLTGFKYIGEKIGALEAEGKKDSFLFGMEESCGYLSGTHVRDKDGVNAAFLVCEMAAFYRSRGLSLWEKLHSLYEHFGYYRDALCAYSFKGKAGFTKMEAIMHMLRSGINEIGGKKVLSSIDYAVGFEGLPKSNVLKFILADHCSLMIRPSGTEPKLKAYLSVCAESGEEAKRQEQEIRLFLEQMQRDA